MATAEIAASFGEPREPAPGPAAPQLTPAPANAPHWTSACANVWRHQTDVVEVSFAARCALDAPVVRDVAEGVASIVDTGTVHVLFDIFTLEHVAPAAVDAFRAVRGLGRVALLGLGPADRVLARFFMTAMPEDTPTHIRYFEDREAAFAYLGGRA